MEQDPSVPPASEPSGQSVRRRKRVIALVAVLVLVMVCAPCACAASACWRFLAPFVPVLGETRTSIEDAYPNFRVVGVSPSGYTLQHVKYDALLVAVPLIDEDDLYWDVIPREAFTSTWKTTETFFRHGSDRPADSRTRMNYDIKGFAEAYESVDVGSGYAVCAVWLDGVDAYGVETYIVLLSERGGSFDPDVSMTPVGASQFVRDSRTGEWTGHVFVTVDSARDLGYLPTTTAGEYPKPIECRDVAVEFVGRLRSGDVDGAFGMQDAGRWQGGTLTDLKILAKELQAFESQEPPDAIGWDYSVDDHTLDVFVNINGSQGKLFCRVQVVQSPDATYHPSMLEISPEPFETLGLIRGFEQ